MNDDEASLLAQFAAAELVREAEEHAEQVRLLRNVVEDYDRRRTHWWGRLLLWLLRKTT